MLYKCFLGWNCGVMVAMAVASIANAEATLTLDSNAQLLLDDRIIDESVCLQRTIHRPEMYADNPVLTYENPWEYSFVSLWGTVLFDEQDKKFKAWYQTWGALPDDKSDMSICYSESLDGITWTKPDLGLHEFEGSKKNNIILVPQVEWMDSPTVVKDLDEPDPNRRYKMSFHESSSDHGPHQGIWHAVSPDGIHFERLEGPVVKAGDKNSFFWNPMQEKWTVISRFPGRGDRTIAISEGDTFGEYGPIRLIFERDHLDPQRSDLYSMPVISYEGMLIGFPEVYNHGTRRAFTQLAWSHDGVNWSRDPERQPFMLWGKKPDWDWGRRHPQNGPVIRRGDKLWLYFGGRSVLKLSNDPKRHVGAIGLAFLRVDGFCSMDADLNQGTLTTRPFKFTGTNFEVNADLRESGEMRVAVLDEDGNVIPGFDSSNCGVLIGDDVQHTVMWAGAKELSELLGQTVRLRFQYHDGELYSFRIRE